MKYINKNTGEIISEETFKMLNDSAKQNFILVKESEGENGQGMTIGDGIAVVALSPVLIPILLIKSIF